ncbi:MAG TPA: DegT/DnrJ/EryC1/StrS family aminotransferase [Bacillota bacterium]|nr:DegT/DnrJ/EryC1/StrS family aminotransferase [Bacillota bacterium]
MSPIQPFETPLYVTRPLLPDVQALSRELQEIWDSKWLTNHGIKHNTLEAELSTVLKTPNVSLFNNGTLALLVALKALELPMGSEIITTPFTFPATPHCISWNGMRPVFCDITPDLMTIDPEQIERHITPNTSAILGVHVYGFPCAVEAIQRLADKHGLKIIYDAAHVFTTEIAGQGIGCFGDISMFSFHATKLFHSIEGGCLAYTRSALKDRIYLLRNFGIRNEESVTDIGINGKLNELQAAVGLLNLRLVEAEKQKRVKLRALYQEGLSGIEGLTVPRLPANTTDSCQYFVVRVEAERFGLNRDELYNRLKDYNIYARKYFYPLCSEYEPYRAIPSSQPENLPVANRIKSQVLCLPFYGELTAPQVEQICDTLRQLSRQHS